MESELEKVFRKTIEKQSRRIAALVLDLDLAHSQIEILKEEKANIENKNDAE